MISLTRVCGVAASVLMLTICSAVVAGAEPASQTNSNAAPPATITLQISSGSTGRTTTTVTVEVLPSTAGQPTQIRVATDSDSGTPAILGATIGGTSVKNVSVDMQHPFDWNVVASAPAPVGGTTAAGCGPHPPADMPGCSRRQDTQVTPQPAAALPPAVAATPGSTASTPQAPPANGANVSTLQAPSTNGGNASTPLTYTVQPGDSLAKIAQRFYGSGDSHALARIADANAGQVMNDGRTFDDPSLIQPGWALVIPEPTYAIADQDGMRLYTVQPGDTLAGIAARLLGDKERWPDVDAINQDTELVAGQMLADNPDLIWPGMQLRLPAVSSSSPVLAPAASVAQAQP